MELCTHSCGLQCCLVDTSDLRVDGIATTFKSPDDILRICVHNTLQHDSNTSYYTNSNTDTFTDTGHTHFPIRDTPTYRY